jgi:hypothetical protein
MKTSRKSTNVIEPKVKATIAGHGRGWVFTPQEFLAIGDPRSISMALTRLARKGIVRQLTRGLYDYPKSDPQLGVLSPSIDEVARALTYRHDIRLQPSGGYAANLLGLSDQVPMKIVFLTDGPNRRIQLGKLQIVLKRTSPRNMAAAGKISGLVIQALRHLGQRNIDDKMIQKLKLRLSAKDKKQLLTDLRHAPVWAATVMRRIAETSKS